MVFAAVSPTRASWDRIVGEEVFGHGCPFVVDCFHGESCGLLNGGNPTGMVIFLFIFMSCILLCSPKVLELGLHLGKFALGFSQLPGLVRCLLLYYHLQAIFSLGLFLASKLRKY